MLDDSFRPVARDDLPMLAEWLKDPVVAEWWPDPRHQLAMITEDPDLPAMRQLIAFHGETAVGYAQHFPAHEWDAPHLHDVPQDSIAIDVFSVPECWGHGGTWLRALGDLLLSEVSALVIDPGPDNHRTIRAYEKAGFCGEAIHMDGEGQPARIMTRLR